MSIASIVRRIPLWLIFAGLLVLQLAPRPAFRRENSRSYKLRNTPTLCSVKTLDIGSPVIYSATNDTCRGSATFWHRGAIGATVGGSLMLAGLVTTTVAERRRGSSWRQFWLAALIVALALGGLASFAGGLGSSTTCRNSEGLCGWPFIIFGGIGFTAALIAVGLTLRARRHTSRLTRAAAYGAIPAMVAVGIVNALL